MRLPSVHPASSESRTRARAAGRFPCAAIATTLSRSGATRTIAVADATALPSKPATFDVAVSGLVLNFVPSPVTMLAEMRRVTVAGGIVGVGAEVAWPRPTRPATMGTLGNHLAGRVDPLTSAILVFPLFLVYQLGILLHALPTDTLGLDQPLEEFAVAGAQVQHPRFGRDPINDLVV